ncbi:MAG: peptidyl-alpha-hydroxyglycine alpha-amidating lyase family protein [Bryobacter sp.]|nr:peptidyl-alpha-hydroxyglycine alpha-amidating lyase family protein [Bryobacter sp.]
MKSAIGFLLFLGIGFGGERWEVVANWPQLPANIQMEAVSGVRVDAQNRVWVFHRNKQHPILCLDGATGKLIKSIGADMFVTEHGLSLAPDGKLWVTDIGTHEVIVLDEDGKVHQRLGQKGKAGWGPNQFDRPTTVAFDAAGTAYVADGYGNGRVAKFSTAGKYLGEWGKAGTGPGEFRTVHDIAIGKDGLAYVADRVNGRIQIFDLNGKYLREWKSPALGRPWAIVAAPDGTFYVGDGGDAADAKQTGEAPTERSRIHHVDAQGKILATWGAHGKAPGEFIWLHDMALGPDGALYAGDVKDGKRIQKFVRR